MNYFDEPEHAEATGLTSSPSWRTTHFEGLCH